MKNVEDFTQSKFFFNIQRLQEVFGPVCPTWPMALMKESDKTNMNHLNWMLTMATTIGLLVRKYVRWIMSGRLFVRMTSVGFCHFIWFAVYSGLEFLFILCHRFAFIHSISLENAMLNTPNQIVQFILLLLYFFFYWQLVSRINETHKTPTKPIDVQYGVGANVSVMDFLVKVKT